MLHPNYLANGGRGGRTRKIVGKTGARRQGRVARARREQCKQEGMAEELQHHEGRSSEACQTCRTETSQPGTRVTSHRTTAGRLVRSKKQLHKLRKSQITEQTPAEKEEVPANIADQYHEARKATGSKRQVDTDICSSPVAKYAGRSGGDRHGSLGRVAGK